MAISDLTPEELETVRVGLFRWHHEALCVAEPRSTGAFGIPHDETYREKARGLAVDLKIIINKLG
jgi:hypothetical protein